jgi:hypothetical protein
MSGRSPVRARPDVERIQPVDPGLTLAEMQAGRSALGPASDLPLHVRLWPERLRRDEC